MSAIGLRVGPFEIQDDVTVPGPGSWYRARRTGLTRRQPAEVLVRLLGPTPTTRELAAAQRQFDVLRAVDDPRFPRAIALYEGSGALAVDAPLGPSLDRIIEARLLGDVTMTPATLLDLALDLTDALAHAHGRGLHHGHLSANAVTLASDGHLVLWGLGASERRPPFSWLSPERARGEAASAMTDQWSIGALVVSLVTGRTPWSPGDVDVDPRSGDATPFIDPLARQWPALGRLVRRLMDPNPALRFPSLHPVRLELLALSRRAGGTSERRSLAAWLQRQIEPAETTAARIADASGMAEATGAEAETDRSAPTRQVGPVPAAAPAAVSVAPDAPRAPVAIQVRAAAPKPVEEPASQDAPPVIHAATRDADGAGTSDRRRRSPLPAESLDIVGPDAVPDEMPEARAPQPATVAAQSTPAFVDAGPPSIADEATEFAEDLLPTEMATEMHTELAEDDEPMVQIPPIRPAPSSRALRVELTDESLAGLPGDMDEPGPEPLRPAARTPDYADKPVPTLPGMEVPEPSADRPVLAVQVELDEDDGPEALEAGNMDDLLVEDPLVEDITGEVVDGRVAVAAVFEEDDDDPEDAPAERQRAAPTVQFELDDDFDLDDARVGALSPRPTVVPFTDPHFTGPSLRLEEPASLPPMAPTRRQPAPPADGPVFHASSRWPWERDDRRDPEPPEADVVVQAAPYIASATVAVLAALLVLNVLV